MTATVHTLTPGQYDPELLALSASGSALVSGIAWAAIGLPIPSCVFHTVTGCPCPTCGATRCLISLLHGHISQAIAWNPLIFTILAAAVLLNLYSLAVLAAKLPRLRLAFTTLDARILRLSFVLLIAANWSYEIHHGV